MNFKSVMNFKIKRQNRGQSKRQTREQTRGQIRGPAAGQSEVPVLGQARGQVIIEYVLLLLVAMGLALLLIRAMVSRNPDDPGFLIKKWYDIGDAISKDNPEKP